MKTLLYLGIGLVALLALLAVGGNWQGLPYVGIAVVAVIIFLFFKTAR
jgi:hypothetical protein